MATRAAKTLESLVTKAASWSRQQRGHLIVAHEVDERRHGPPSTVEYGGSGTNRDGPPGTLDAAADRGYYAGEEILTCEEAGITVTPPKPMTLERKGGRGRFGKQDFATWQRRTLTFVLPAKKSAHSFTTKELDLFFRL